MEGEVSGVCEGTVGGVPRAAGAAGVPLFTLPDRAGSFIAPLRGVSSDFMYIETKTNMTITATAAIFAAWQQVDLWGETAMAVGHRDFLIHV